MRLLPVIARVLMGFCLTASPSPAWSQERIGQELISSTAALLENSETQIAQLTFSPVSTSNEGKVLLEAHVGTGYTVDTDPVSDYLVTHKLSIGKLEKRIRLAADVPGLLYLVTAAFDDKRRTMESNAVESPGAGISDVDETKFAPDLSEKSGGYLVFMKHVTSASQISNVGRSLGHFADLMSAGIFTQDNVYMLADAFSAYRVDPSLDTPAPDCVSDCFPGMIRQEGLVAVSPKFINELVFFLKEILPRYEDKAPLDQELLNSLWSQLQTTAGKRLAMQTVKDKGPYPISGKVYPDNGETVSPFSISILYASDSPLPHPCHVTDDTYLCTAPFGEQITLVPQKEEGYSFAAISPAALSFTVESPYTEVPLKLCSGGCPPQSSSTCSSSSEGAASSEQQSSADRPTAAPTQTETPHPAETPTTAIAPTPGATATIAAPPASSTLPAAETCREKSIAAEKEDLLRGPTKLKKFGDAWLARLVTSAGRQKSAALRKSWARATKKFDSLSSRAAGAAAQIPDRLVCRESSGCHKADISKFINGYTKTISALREMEIAAINGLASAGTQKTAEKAIKSVRGESKRLISLAQGLNSKCD